MADYNSDHIIASFEGLDAIERAADHMAKLNAVNLKINEVGYTHTIILAPSESESGLDEMKEGFLRGDIKSLTEARTTLLINERKTKEQAAKQAEKVRQEQRRREDDERQYELLKAKLGK